MASIQELKEDLAFVRSAVRRPRMSREIAAIYWLWAVLVLAGYVLADFRPHAAGLYWFVVLPLGGVLSGLLARRAQLRLGERDPEAERRVAGHWFVVIFGAFVAMAPLYIRAALGEALPGSVGAWVQAPLLAIAVGYALAGIHIHRPLLYVGGIMAAGYVLVAVRPELPYVSTLVGVAIATGLVMTAVVTRDEARAAGDV